MSSLIKSRFFYRHKTSLPHLIVYVEYKAQMKTRGLGPLNFQWHGFRKNKTLSGLSIFETGPNRVKNQILAFKIQKKNMYNKCI